MIAYLLAIATCLAGFVRRNSRALSVLMLFSLWVLMGLNDYNADFVSYQYVYNSTTIQAGAGQTVGYWFLIGISKELGFDFFTFRSICCAIGLLNYYLFISRYTRGVALALSLYLFCPFFYDIVQFRFFFASSVVIVGMRFLIEGRGRRRIFFAVFVLAASLVHPACALFLLFYLTCLSDKQAFTVSVVLFIVCLAATYSGIAVTVASLVMDSVKAEAYLTTMGRFGFIPYWASIVLSLLFVAGIRRSSTGGALGTVSAAKEPSKGDIDYRALMFNDFARKAVLVFLPLGAFLPLSVQNFYRIIRSSLIIVHIYYVNAAFGAERVSISETERKLLFGFFWVWLALTAYVLFGKVWDLVIVTELENNILWS